MNIQQVRIKLDGSVSNTGPLLAYATVVSVEFIIPDIKSI